MKKKICKFIQSRLLRRITLSTYAIYTGIWTIVEPLSLSWISNHLSYWRLGLIGASGLVTLALIVPITWSYLGKFEAGLATSNLLDNYVSTGTPILGWAVDGQMGTVVKVNGDYTNDPIDWHVPTDKQGAGVIEFCYRCSRKPFHFYVRVVVISNDGIGQSEKWIRFDHEIAVADTYNRQEEMAFSYQSKKEKGYEIVLLDFKKIVKSTFGQGGWQYHRVTIFRVRGEGYLKRIVFKKW